jgi:hypothetical protein
VKPPEPDGPKTECHPDSWQVYRVRVHSSAMHLDDIYLDEIRFVEQEDAGGHCSARLTINTYGMRYGSVTSGAPPKRTWALNSRPSKTTTRSAGPGDPPAAFEALRKDADALHQEGKPLAAARAELEKAVNATLDRNQP